MKKIINGKLYDTETAIKCGETSWHGASTDLDHCEETLFRKKTGEFFLHGFGGPASRYARSVGLNSWGSGERIMPMSFSEASEWAEENLDADDYEAIFGQVAEDDSRRTVAYSISVTASEKLKRMAAERGVSQSAMIEELILKNC